jgi:four helix bundle protein
VKKLPESPVLMPVHGGYRNLKSFQVAQLVYDVTVRFCNRYIGKRSRTHDQMVQAARSGVQNIAEGSMASGTSKKTELKLTNVAKASLEELRLDYEDFLHQRGLELWDRQDSRRAALIARRPVTADDVAAWAKDVRNGRCRQHGQDGRDGQRTRVSMGSTMSTKSTKPASPGYPEIAANGVLRLIAAGLQADFVEAGGPAERLRARAQRKPEGIREVAMNG